MSKILFEDQTSIKLAVVKLDGKRLTKSTIDQLNVKLPFDPLLNFTGDKIFGYVNFPKSKGGWVAIAQVDGKLVKFQTLRILWTSMINENSNFDNVYNDLSRTFKLLFNEKYNKLHQEETAKLSDIMEQNDLNALLEIRDKAKDFIEKLADHQIII